MEQFNGTPKARPHLKFANSVYTTSPAGNKRFGTPRPAMGSRRVLDRDTLPSSNLNESSIDTARNIFRASSLSSNTGPRFEPSIPGNTLRKVFAPAATPEPKKLFRDSSTKATPRRTLAESTSADLFKMAIPEPPSDLTGAELAKKVPEDLDQQLGSVFADQYLEHLCPKNFNQLQRRQFFCILDLRRLKHAANEIFTRKDWKLNIMNFAKEFEKSRSLILLRYGLYEFRNVKPSADILKKWRVAHGLQDEEQEARGSTSLRSSKSSTKRKAQDEPDASEDRSTRQAGGKRRAVDEEEPASTNKRRASLADDAQPTKQQKTTSSATKTFLERIASKPATPTTAITGSTPSKPLFGANSDGGIARSAMDKGSAGGNIFGYLSDSSKRSPVNSGAEGDGESETESEHGPEAPQSNGATNGATAAPATSAFTSNTSSVSGVGTADSNISSEGRESTPGRSLFDRVTKGTDGAPVRFGQAEGSQAENTTGAASAAPQAPASDSPTDKTWTPGTPLKFAPQPALGSSLFGGASTPSGSTFPTTSQPTSNLFGAQKSTASVEEKPQQAIGEGEKSGDESDKENVSQPAPKLFPPSTSKPTNGTSQPSTTSLFKPPSTDSGSNAGDVKGASGVESQKPVETGGTPSIFGNKNQPTGQLGSSTPLSQPSSLFGNKPTSVEPTANSKTTAAAPEPPKTGNLFGASASTPAKPSSEAPKTTSLFGTPASTPALASSEAPKTTSSLFGNAGAASTEAPKSGGLFGSTAQAATSNLFGGSSSGSAMFGSTQKPTPATSSLFGSGSTTEALPKGSETPKAATKTESSSTNNMFGSPMKQDGASPQKRGLDDAMQEDQPSPAKKPFGTAAPPVFFGGPQTSSAPGSNSTPTFSFGSNQQTTTPSTSAPMFGQNTPAAGGMNFNFGGGQAGSSTNFSSSFGGTSSTPSFNFGGSSQPDQQPGSKSFTFGENNTGAAPSPAPMAGGSQDASNPFSFNASSATPRATTPSGRPIKKPNFGASKARAAARGGMGASPAPSSNMFGGAQSGTPAQAPATTPSIFGGNQGGASAQSSAPTFNFTAPSPQPQGQQQNPFGANPGGSLFGGASTTGTSMFTFGTQ